MTDIAELGLAVRSDGVVVAKDRLRGMTTEAGFAEKAVAGLITRAGQLVGAYATWRVAEAWIGKFIDSTIEAEKAQTQLNAVLKSTGGVAGLTADELNKMAKSLQGVTSYGDETIIMGQSLLLTFTKIGREVFPEALEAALNISTAMKTDLNSAIVMVGKSLNDPILGLTALTRAGIQFTDTQKETIKALAETNKIADAQKLILKELETQFGGSAREARGTLGGAIKALEEAFGDLFEANGPASDKLRENVERLISTISDPKFVTAVQNIGIAMFNTFNDVLSKIEEIIAAVQSFFAQYSDPYLKTMKDYGTKDAAAQALGDAMRKGTPNQLGESSGFSDLGSFFRPFQSDNVGPGASYQGMLSSMGLYKPPPGGGSGMTEEGEKQKKAYDKVIETAEKRIAQMQTEAEAATMVGYAGDALVNSQKLLADAQASGLSLGEDQLKQLEALAEKTTAAQIAMEGAQTTMSNRTVWEEVADDIARLNVQLDAGAISWDTYARAAGSTVSGALQTTFGALAGLSGALEQVFEDNKAFSIATAVLKGAESIASAYASGSAIGGPPVGLLFAGIAAATAALNVAAVASVSKNSKSIPGGAGGGGSVAATASQQGSLRPTAIINLQGSNADSYSHESVKKLLQTITEVGQDEPGLIVKVVETAKR